MREPRNLVDTLKLWAVTSASPDSTIFDCYFETTPRGLVRQGGGGLLDQKALTVRNDDRFHLVAIYDNEADAIRHAKRLLEEAQAVSA